MKISWRIVNGKYVICKNGVYLSLTKEEFDALSGVVEDIKTDKREFYKEDSRK